MGNTIEMWTIYQSPSDFPGETMARKFEIVDGRARATEHVKKGDLEGLRESFKAAGLFVVARLPGDDPCIVEVWL